MTIRMPRPFVPMMGIKRTRQPFQRMSASASNEAGPGIFALVAQDTESSSSRLIKTHQSFGETAASGPDKPWPSQPHMANFSSVYAALNSVRTSHRTHLELV